MSAPLQQMIPRGATGKSVVLRAKNAISGVPQGSMNTDVAGLVLRYYRMGGQEQAVSLAISNAVLGSLSNAWSAGGVFPIWDGYFRVDVPDAAWAKLNGVNNVLITGTATGVNIDGAMVTLVDYPITAPQSATPNVY